MKRYLLMSLFLLLIFSFNTYALSDGEYEILKENSPTFAQADKRLGKTWQDIKSTLNEDEKKKLLSDQREWIKNGWDTHAAQLMKAQNLNRTKAYTQAIEDRILYLQKFSTNSQSFHKQDSGDKSITVESEGMGASKMEALENAWMEAVRKAVGIYLSGKTEVNNDELKEKIIAHSRGQVKSYKEVASSLNDGVWKVAIIANIDKDLLKEPEQTTTSQKLSFDGSNIAANNTTTETKKQSGEELAIETAKNIDWKNMINYKSKLISQNNQENKKSMLLWNTIFINLNNYKHDIEPFENAIAQCAIKTFSKKNFDKGSAKEILKLLSSPDKINTTPESYRFWDGLLNAGNLYNLGVSGGYSDTPYICFYKNLASNECYEVDKDLFRKILKVLPKTFRIEFTAESGSDFDSILGNSWTTIQFPTITSDTSSNGHYIFLSPEFRSRNGIASIFQMATELKLDKEDLLNIKEITGKFSIENLRR